MNPNCKILLLLVPTLSLALSGCEDKGTVERGDDHRTSNPQSLSRTDSEKKEPIDTRKKAEKHFLNRKDLITSGVFQQSVQQLNELASHLAKEEGISTSIALNELYLVLSKGRDQGYISSINGVFSQALLDSPDGIASVMAELPGGDLRRLGVAVIQGMGLPTTELRKVYISMPESTDRYDIAKLLAVQLLMETGVDESLAFISQIPVQSERDAALSALVSPMSFSSAFGGREFSVDEINKVKSYAKSISREKNIKDLK